jgi:hypothetical protein
MGDMVPAPAPKRDPRRRASSSARRRAARYNPFMYKERKTDP